MTYLVGTAHMKLISQRRTVTNYSYSHRFESKSRPGCGYAFECDKDGNLIGPAWLNHAARRAEVVAKGDHDDLGIVEYVNHYHEPAIGICDCCRAKVALYGFTNTCECGADYNMSGQRLASRAQWGEETGESVADILAADDDYDYGCQ